MRETVKQKAVRYLIEGRVIIVTAKKGYIRAVVRGEGALYDTGYLDGLWFCTCPARAESCCHVQSLRKITAPDVPEPPMLFSAVSVKGSDRSFEGRR